MPIEIIDLTDSPDDCPLSPPRSSSNAPMILTFPTVPINPNQHHTHHHHATLLPAPALVGHTYEYDPSQIAPRFLPNIDAGQVTTVLELVPESNAFLFPNGVRLREPWTQKEHELFLMGLIKFGKGRWSKIQKHFLWNKTPQQVQSYATSFFRHLPATYVCGFRRRKPITNYSAVAAANLVTRNMNIMYSMPMIPNDAPAQETLALFPENAPFSNAPLYAGEASNNNNIAYGFQMLTGGASTSVTASAHGEVDLELRLG